MRLYAVRVAQVKDEDEHPCRSSADSLRYSSPMSLAQRTGDAASLALARPVLLELGDTLFLRKLEEVATHM